MITIQKTHEELPNHVSKVSTNAELRRVNPRPLMVSAKRSSWLDVSPDKLLLQRKNFSWHKGVLDVKAEIVRLKSYTPIGQVYSLVFFLIEKSLYIVML